MKEKRLIKKVKRIVVIILIAALLVWIRPDWGSYVYNKLPESIQQPLHTSKEFTEKTIKQGIDGDQIKGMANSFYDSMLEIFEEAEEEIPQEKEEQAEDEEQAKDEEQAEDIELSTPEEQSFSIGNLELGDTKKDVEENYGEPEYEGKNEYGITWASYHEEYHNFLMVAYDKQNNVQGLFTNQDLLSSASDIALGDTKDEVNEQLGEPEKTIRNGMFNYSIEGDGEYDTYKIDNHYITFFYDIHESDEVTAVQLIDEDLEGERDQFYAQGSEDLQEGFEQQLFELTNAERVKRDFPILKWNEDVSKTARKHSADMADQHYFSHTNLDGQSPADRMEEDNIAFKASGENLAYGQFSSIFAHEGLMNSEGHRENILNDTFTELGTGVDFDEDNQPFYSENYLSR